MKPVATALGAVFLCLCLSGCVTVAGLTTVATMGYQAYCDLPKETRQNARDKLTGGRQYLCPEELVVP